VIIELTRLLSNNSGEEKSGQPKKISIYPLQLYDKEIADYRTTSAETQKFERFELHS
jgi:hypothetical protein